MKILMIGGNGFLGKHVQELLTSHEVIAPSHYEVNWKLGNYGALQGYQPDIVIHLLAIYGGLPFCLNNRVRMGIENLEINAHVFRYLVDTKPAKVITIGSGCEYPGYLDGILDESRLGDGKLHKSVEHYGYTKLMQLKICESMHEEFGTEFEHVVLANMYGPGDIFDEHKSHVVGGLIYKFVKALKENTAVQLLGTGRAVRDLIYVKDVAEMIHRLVELPMATNTPLNASTGHGTNIKTLAELISQTLKFPNEILWGDESQDGSLIKYLSSDKTESLLGWKPSTHLETGIKETIAWYLNAT